MSVTKSYNKYNDTYYAYETSYIWDEKRQKKIQKKVCIGKYDPVTGGIIPNAKRGRPSKKQVIAEAPSNIRQAEQGSPYDQEQLLCKIGDCVSDMEEIRSEMVSLSERFSSLESKISALQKIISDRSL